MTQSRCTGFMYPRTPRPGRAGIVPPPPWHYSGEMLTIEFRTDPGRRGRAAARPADPRRRRPRRGRAHLGRVAELLATRFDELLDPARGPVQGGVPRGAVHVRGRRPTAGRPTSGSTRTSPWHAATSRAIPRRWREIWLTRAVTIGKAGPRLEPGGRFGATLSTWGRRIADARFTITGTADSAGFVNGHPMLHSRQMPAIEMRRHATASTSSSPCAATTSSSARSTRATPNSTLYDCPTEELHLLEPIEMIGGYWRQVGNSWHGGTTVYAEPNPMAGGASDDSQRSAATQAADRRPLAGTRSFAEQGENR